VQQFQNKKDVLGDRNDLLVGFQPNVNIKYLAGNKGVAKGEPGGPSPNRMLPRTAKNEQVSVVWLNFS